MAKAGAGTRPGQVEAMKERHTLSAEGPPSDAETRRRSRSKQKSRRLARWTARALHETKMAPAGRCRGRWSAPPPRERTATARRASARQAGGKRRHYEPSTSAPMHGKSDSRGQKHHSYGT